MKKVSIITVCYNSEADIENTIQSVVPFVSDVVEYVVIDGGSTDNTLQILNKYKDKISILVSEPDKGIYDAMNKGINKATGKWFIFINCGDELLHLPHELFNQDNDKYAAIFGSVRVDEDVVIKPTFDWRLKIRNSLPHQGLFYNKSLIDVHFDTQFKIFSDYDFNLKMYKKGIGYLIVDDIIAFHSLIGISNSKKAVKELFVVINKNGGWPFVILSFIYFKFYGLFNRLRKWAK